MVDRQKALLMVLLALLIYPNDIFGEYPKSREFTRTNVSRERLNALNAITIRDTEMTCCKRPRGLVASFRTKTRLIRGNPY